MAVAHRRFVSGGDQPLDDGYVGAGLLDRLHIAVAPMLLGSGRPSVVLPAVETLEGVSRPRTRAYALGADMLFDCELS